MSRVIAYVDGFNLYHGLRARYGRRYLWLDLQRLATVLLRPGQTLVRVSYFTAPVRDRPASMARQRDYLDALAVHCPLVEVREGRFQRKTMTCWQCGSGWTSYEEKESDVSLAVAVVADAALDMFDTALLLSADSDLCPAVREVRRLRPAKRVVAAFPPARHSDDLRASADASLTIGARNIRRSLLPDVVAGPAGVTYRRPKHWS